MELSEISKTTRLPFTYVQFDSTLASAALQGAQHYRCLLIGASNIPAESKPKRLDNIAAASELFGDKSMLHEMAKAYFANSNIEVWALPLPQVDTKIEAKPDPKPVRTDKLAALDSPVTPAAPPAAVTIKEPTLNADMLSHMQFNVIASGYSSTQFLQSLHRELESRAHATRGLEGFAIAAVNGDTVAAARVLKDEKGEKDTVASQFICVVPTSGILSKTHEVAAALCGLVATSAQEDPARPFRTLELQSIKADNKPDSVESREARETALANGVSTLYVDSNNKVRVERLITTFRTQSGDISYLSPSTNFILSFLRWDFARYFGLKYPRHKLASDSYRGSGPVMTPATARAECVCLFRKWEEQGLVQDADTFINGLICEISKSDPTRLNIMLPTRLVSELDIIGASLSFLF